MGNEFGGDGMQPAPLDAAIIPVAVSDEDQFINQCVIAQGEADLIADQYDELADQLATMKYTALTLHGKKVTNPADHERESPLLLQAGAIEYEHKMGLSGLDRMEIQFRGRAGTWREHGRKYRTMLENTGD